MRYFNLVLIGIVETYQKNAFQGVTFCTLPVLYIKDYTMTIKHALEQGKIFIVSCGNSIKILECKNVVYAKADGNYCELILIDNTKFVLCKTLDQVERTMKNPEYFRVHKSYLVNLMSIIEIDKRMVSIVLNDHSIIPIARRKRKEFMKVYFENRQLTVN